MALPQFFDEDGALIIAEMKAELESSLGRALAPGDVEMLLVNGFAYREKLFRIQANEACRQNLVSFATGSGLDYLGQLVGVVRLPAAGASCTIRFTLVSGHTGVVLPKDIRVQSIDGKAIFQTIEEKIVAIGTTTVDIEALCSTPGIVGNGYEAGKISIILDPQPFVSTVANLDTTANGIDEETDEELRERIELAPSSFSVAGPTGAYKFFAKSAHPSIVDVAVTSPTPGQVNIYPLCKDGTLPDSDILAAVEASCNDEKVRPLTDTLVVAEPDVTNYAISVQLVLYTGAVNEDVIDEVTNNLTIYKNAGKNILGRDVIKSQISALSVIEGKVYNVTVVSPSSDIVVAENEYANCTGITVTITGSNGG